MDGHDPKCANLRALPVSKRLRYSFYEEVEITLTSNNLTNQDFSSPRPERENGFTDITKIKAIDRKAPLADVGVTLPPGGKPEETNIKKASKKAFPIIQ